MTKKYDVSVINLVSDVAGTISFTTLVSDSRGAPVLHVNSSTSNQLIVTITNQISIEMDVKKLTGSPTSSNSNIIFSFPNNQLYFYTAPTIDATGSTPGTWELATDAKSSNNWVSKIYLANTGTCKLGAKGADDDTLKLTINYGGAVPDDPTTINVPVQVKYQNIQSASGTPIQGSTPLQTLSLMADAGRPLPLVGEFVGPCTVLNDGTTPRDLTLRLVNTSLDPIQFIVPPSGEPTQSYIEVAFPVSDSEEDAIWALCDTAAWESFKGNASLSGSAAAGWNVTASTPGVFKLRPDFTKVKNIPPAGTLDLVLKGVTSSLEPGIVQVQVSLKRFVLYGTQTFGVALEKTPLVYNSGLGSGMTLSAGSLELKKALGISGSLGINTSTPSQPLDVNGNANISEALSADCATIKSNLTVNGNANISNSLSASSISADCATIKSNLTVNPNPSSHSDGNILGGFTTIRGALMVYGPVVLSRDSELRARGKCYNASGSWDILHHPQLIENVQPFSDGLAQVLKLDPIRYNFKEEAGLGTKDEHVGVSAQALENVAPYMVSKTHIKPDSDEEYLSIKSGHFTYMLINAVKELHAEIEAMKTEIEVLKKR